MGVQLGPFQIDHPFILAPMAGITNSPFRRLMRRLGSSMVVSELVSADGIEFASRRTLELLRFHPEERPVGLQIFGEDPELLCKAARKVEELGGDFVDLNLGCPVQKVVKKGAGAALCRDPAELGRILGLMVKAVQIPVTIKIRTGWDAQSRNAIEVVRAAADAGVAWVAIHGRTRAQGYEGLADWDFIGEVKAKSPIPIIGNGDLNTPEVAVEKYKTYGVDAVLIGRGALRNPFLFRQADQLLKGEAKVATRPEELVALVRELKVLLEESFAPPMAMIQSRKFLSWFSSGYPGCHDFRKKVFQTPDPQVAWSEAIAFFEKFAKGAEAQDLAFLDQPFLMGGHG